NPNHSMDIAPPRRVFLIEDSRQVRERVVEQLGDIPDVAVVGTAESEEEAVAALRQTPCDVVVLDIKLRQGSGVGVLRALRELGSAAGLPRVRIVFSTQTAYQPYTTNLGAQYFFDKSSDLTALMALIRELSGGA